MIQNRFQWTFRRVFDYEASHLNVFARKLERYFQCWCEEGTEIIFWKCSLYSHVQTKNSKIFGMLFMHLLEIKSKIDYNWRPLIEPILRAKIARLLWIDYYHICTAKDKNTSTAIDYIRSMHLKHLNLDWIFNQPINSPHNWLASILGILPFVDW